MASNKSSKMSARKSANELDRLAKRNIKSFIKISEAIERKQEQLRKREEKRSAREKVRLEREKLRTSEVLSKRAIKAYSQIEQRWGKVLEKRRKAEEKKLKKAEMAINYVTMLEVRIEAFERKVDEAVKIPVWRTIGGKPTLVEKSEMGYRIVNYLRLLETKYPYKAKELLDLIENSPLVSVTVDELVSYLSTYQTDEEQTKADAFFSEVLKILNDFELKYKDDEEFSKTVQEFWEDEKKNLISDVDALKSNFKKTAKSRRDIAAGKYNTLDEAIAYYTSGEPEIVEELIKSYGE